MFIGGHWMWPTNKKERGEKNKYKGKDTEEQQRQTKKQIKQNG